ncbi:MAG: sigma-70 family RNA polymerase sigma factor [Anaerolineae bacterium]
MSELPDSDLLARIQQGDEDALLALHQRYINAVYAVAYRVLGEQMAAEEVAQDTFMRLWERGHQYDPERGAFLSWLLTIARRRAIDVLRQRRGQPPPEATFSIDAHPYLAETLPDSDEQRELRRSLVGVLGSLPEDQRKAIELAYFYGMSHGDIAAYLGEPLGTVKTRIRLGMQKLREAWFADVRENKSNPIDGNLP